MVEICDDGKKFNYNLMYGAGASADLNAFRSYYLALLRMHSKNFYSSVSCVCTKCTWTVCLDNRCPLFSLSLYLSLSLSLALNITISVSFLSLSHSALPKFFCLSRQLGSSLFESFENRLGYLIFYTICFARQPRLCNSTTISFICCISRARELDFSSLWHWALERIYFVGS